MSSKPSKQLLTNGISRETLLNIFTIVEFILFATFFYFTLQKKLIKNIILVISPIFLFFSIFYNFSAAASFDSIPVTIEGILIISLCICYFFEQLNQMNNEFIYSKAEFWAVAGIMLYLAGTFFLFVQAGQLSHNTQRTFWVINLGCNVLKNIMFAVAFSINKNNYQNLRNNPRISQTQLN
ncbi:hypothetical protein QEG73_21700 [Chitinophagaceae bacterium 26-R-25]|nr:hypothetical protein [Chitinophagaceae bacterium 26-R-25]